MSQRCSLGIADLVFSLLFFKMQSKSYQLFWGMSVTARNFWEMSQGNASKKASVGCSRNSYFLKWSFSIAAWLPFTIISTRLRHKSTKARPRTRSLFMPCTLNPWLCLLKKAHYFGSTPPISLRRKQLQLIDQSIVTKRLDFSPLTNWREMKICWG